MAIPRETACFPGYLEAFVKFILRTCLGTTPLNLVSTALAELYVANKMPSERNCICLIPAKPLENKPCGYPIALMNALYWANLNGVVLGLDGDERYRRDLCRPTTPAPSPAGSTTSRTASWTPSSPSGTLLRGPRPPGPRQAPAPPPAPRLMKKTSPSAPSTASAPGGARPLPPARRS